MQKTVDTLVVIPAFNEELSLGLVIRDIRSQELNVKIVVIDDGSSDQTFEVASNLGVQVLKMPFNTGVGAAMRLGFKFAFANDFKKVIQIDADGQHEASDIHKIIGQLDNFDVVIGSRFADGAESFQIPKYRRFVMYIVAKITSKLVGVKLTDVTSGFRGSNLKAIEVFKSKYPPEYLGDTIESIIIAHRSGLTITEFPTTIRSRAFGNSSQSFFKATGYTLRAFLVVLLASIHKKID